MPYTYRVFDSIDEVDVGAWERVRSQCGGSIFMDTRFIAAVETSMKPSCRFWYVILYDEDNSPVACACLTAMTIDLVDLADPRLASILRYLPKMLSRFRKPKVFICGLPGSPGAKNLALTLPKSSPQILSVLDGVICDLAAHTRTDAVVYKEFGKDDLEWTNPLLNLGYRRIQTPPMHCFEPSFQDFTHYSAALKSRYRKEINRSTQKLERSGVRLSILTDPEEILKVYTPEVHALYSQVIAKADINHEVLPIEFFHQLTLRLKGKVDLLVFSRNSRIMAFGWGLHDGSTYHMLYIGFDYQLNRESDLYFNMMYAALDRAFRKRVSKINVGQTANTFKARMGCYSEPLYVFAKGLGPLMSRTVRYGANWMVAQKPTLPPFDIFRSEYRRDSE